MSNIVEELRKAYKEYHTYITFYENGVPLDFLDWLTEECEICE